MEFGCARHRTLRCGGSCGAHGLEFDDPRGFLVYLGLAHDLNDRVMVWKALRDSLEARNVLPKFVDIRYPLAPFYGE